MYIKLYCPDLTGYMKTLPSDFDDNPFLRTIDLAYSDRQAIDLAYRDRERYREDRKGMRSRYIQQVKHRVLCFSLFLYEAPNKTKMYKQTKKSSQYMSNIYIWYNGKQI